MKTRILGMSLFLALVTTVYGQSSYDVPFAFQAGGQTFTAGEYQISVDSPTRGLQIRQQGGAPIMVRMQNEIHGNAIAPSDKLVFQCYGDACFLSQVWRGGEAVGAQLPQPKNQRVLAKATPSTEAAVLAQQ